MKLIPNILTSLRLAAAPVVAWLIVTGQFHTAVFVLGVAAITDWLDGAAARRLGVSSRTGMVLDPLADKVMLVVMFLSLGYARLIPWWLLGLVIGRDLVIVIGSLLLRIFRGSQKFVPSITGKISTFFQIVYALLTLLNAAWPYRILNWLETAGIVATAVFTTVSGVGYIRRGIRMARREIVY